MAWRRDGPSRHGSGVVDDGYGVNDMGMTRLHRLCYQDDTDGVLLYLSNDIYNEVAGTDMTSRMYEDEVTELIDEKNVLGNSALHYCAKMGNVTVAKKLISHRADVNSINTKGWSVLMVACAHQMAGMTHLLLLHGADHSMNNHDGNYPLHFACANITASTDVLRILLAHGADPLVQNQVSGVTPQDYARHFKREDMVEVLKNSITLGKHANNDTDNNNDDGGDDDALVDEELLPDSVNDVTDYMPQVTEWMG